MEYFITQHDDGSYQIAKFDGGSEPVVIYNVKGRSCDCPGAIHHGKCKHLWMIDHWQLGYYYEGKGKNLVLSELPD